MSRDIKYIGYVENEKADTGLNRFAVGIRSTFSSRKCSGFGDAQAGSVACCQDGTVLPAGHTGKKLHDLFGLLQSVSREVGTGADSHLSALPDERKEVGLPPVSSYPYGCCPASFADCS